MGLNLFKNLSIYYIGSIDSLNLLFNNGIIVPELYNKLKKPKFKFFLFIIIFVRFENFDFFMIFIVIGIARIIIFFPLIFLVIIMFDLRVLI